MVLRDRTFMSGLFSQLVWKVLQVAPLCCAGHITRAHDKGVLRAGSR